MTRLLLLLALVIAGCGVPTERPHADRRDKPAASSRRDETPEAALRSDTPAPAFSAAELERAVHAATNRARRSERLNPFGWEAALVPVARAHSADMAARGFFAHETPDGRTPTDRADAVDFHCRTPLGGGRARVGVGENLWTGFAYTSYVTSLGATGTRSRYDLHTAGSLAETVVTGWLNSPGHRRNLLDPITAKEAIGVWIGDDGAVFVTQALC